MAAPDKVFKQTYAWYKASIDRALAASGLPAAQQPQVEQLIWQMLGVLNPAAPPAVPDLTDFKDTGADAQSLAVAAQIVAEVAGRARLRASRLSTAYSRAAIPPRRWRWSRRSCSRSNGCINCRPAAAIRARSRSARCC